MNEVNGVATVQKAEASQAKSKARFAANFAGGVCDSSVQQFRATIGARERPPLLARVSRDASKGFLHPELFLLLSSTFYYLTLGVQ